MRAFIGVGLCLVLLLATARGAAALSEQDQDLLKQLNQAGLTAYAAGKAAMLAEAGPMIVVGRDVTFRWNGQERHADYTPELYTTLKSLSHLYLGLIVVLEPFMDDAAAHQDVWRPHLEAMRAATLPLQPRLADLGLAGDLLERNRHFQDAALQFIDQALATGSYTREELAGFAGQLRDLLLDNAAVAASAQVDLLHSVVQQWREEVGPEVWDQVHVFIQTPRMPRAGNLQYSYFRQALGEEAVETRLIYAENLWDDKAVTGLYGTLLTDRLLSTLIFGDEYRMDRDLLGDAGEIRSRELLGEPGRPLP